MPAPYDYFPFYPGHYNHFWPPFLPPPFTLPTQNTPTYPYFLQSNSNISSEAKPRLVEETPPSPKETSNSHLKETASFKRVEKLVSKIAPGKKKRCTSMSKARPKKMEQKDGRNSNSNLLRMFFRRVELLFQHRPELLLTIIRKHQLNLSLEDFKNWFEEAKVNFRNYMRVSSVRKLFMGDQFVEEHTKIMRILFKRFL